VVKKGDGIRLYINQITEKIEGGNLIEK